MKLGEDFQIPGHSHDSHTPLNKPSTKIMEDIITGGPGQGIEVICIGCSSHIQNSGKAYYDPKTGAGPYCLKTCHDHSQEQARIERGE
ncbi:hypothetical protein JW707_01640 [Candidatus Woesearchaeota archaeon]|nr:hypothetical protein [Candidatus Woesearchaeota archaeon]